MGQSHYGIYGGLVDDNTAGAGQLGVKVPALFGHTEVVLARPALPYGVFFLPEKGSKVWVQFEGGDSTLPVWTGVQQLPEEWPKPPPDGRMLVTKGGHTLHLQDGESNKRVVLTDGAGGHTLTLDQEGATLAHHDGHVVQLAAAKASVRHGAGLAEIVVEKDKVTIKAGPSSVVLGPDGITVRGTPRISLNGGALPVLRVTDQGIGNLGAPVVMTGPGNPTVTA